MVGIYYSIAIWQLPCRSIDYYQNNWWMKQNLAKEQDEEN